MNNESTNNGLTEVEEKDEGTGRLKRRLKSVRKRKRAQRGFESEAVALKMRLIKVEEDSDR
jgi:hypothetical protein